MIDFNVRPDAQTLKFSIGKPLEVAPDVYEYYLTAPETNATWIDVTFYSTRVSVIKVGTV